MSLFITSLLRIILVRNVVNNLYFRSFSLLKFLVCLVFVIIRFKNSRSCKTSDSVGSVKAYTCHKHSQDRQHLSRTLLMNRA